MKMHANARLSLKGRELLVDRVENAGWSLTKSPRITGAFRPAASPRPCRPDVYRWHALEDHRLLDQRPRGRAGHLSRPHAWRCHRCFSNQCST
jgi:hypothetical protein